MRGLATRNVDIKANFSRMPGGDSPGDAGGMTTITSNQSWSLLITTALIGGAVAGPFLLVVATIQGALRTDYNQLKHSISALALGSELGWIQSLTFLIAGGLMIGFAAGLFGAVRRQTFWGPLLIAVWGAGALLCGIFPADPDPDYPSMPSSVAGDETLTGLLHNWSAGVGFPALFAASLIFARWFARSGQRGWAVYSVISGAGFLIFTFLHNYFGRQLDRWLSDFGGLFQRCAVTIGFAWLTVLAVHFLLLRRRRPA